MRAATGSDQASVKKRTLRPPPPQKTQPPATFVFLPPTSNSHRTGLQATLKVPAQRPPFPARSYGAPQFVRARLSIGFFCLCSADYIGGYNTPSTSWGFNAPLGLSAPCPQTRLLTRGETRAGLRRALV